MSINAISQGLNNYLESSWVINAQSFQRLYKSKERRSAQGKVQGVTHYQRHLDDIESASIAKAWRYPSRQMHCVRLKRNDKIVHKCVFYKSCLTKSFSPVKAKKIQLQS